MIRVLEDMEDEKFDRLDFVELNACSGAAWAGSSRWKTPMWPRPSWPGLRKYLPVSCNRTEDAGCAERLEWTDRLEFAPVMKLAENVEDAMR